MWVKGLKLTLSEEQEEDGVKGEEEDEKEDVDFFS